MTSVPTSPRPDSARALARRAAGGFTLVEIVLVLVLISVLLVAIVPKFTGARSIGKDQTAQATVEAALDTQIAIRTDSPTRTMSADPSVLRQYQPDARFVNGTTPSPDSQTASVAVLGQAVGIAVLGGRSTCFLLRRDLAASTPAAGRLFAFRPNGGATSCTGTGALGLLPDAAQPGKGASWNAPLRAS